MKGLNYQVKTFFKKNGPTILTCLSIAGTISTTVLAVKATPKAIKLLDDKKTEKGSKLTVLETIETAAPMYIPSAITGMATIGCILGVNALNRRQQASMMSAYALVENTFKDYRKKIRESYGQETDQKIMDEVISEKADKMYFSSNSIFSSNDLPEDEESCMHTFYDNFSGRYFESTFQAVRNAEYHLNRNFIFGGYADITEWYHFLGLPNTIDDGYIGWSADEFLEGGLYPWIDFDHCKVTLEDGMECYVISFVFGPDCDYLDKEY